MDGMKKESTGDGATSARIPVESTRARLQEAIDLGRLPPGQRLPEERVAAAMSVSRARVREALAQLAHDGLVELRANRGAFVTRPSIDDALHICEARMVAERAMARLAAERASADDLEQMRHMLTAEQTAWDTGDVAAAVGLSRNFHRKIAEAAGNPILAEILSNLLSRSALTQAVYVARGSAGCLCDDHVGLLHAFEARDPDRAEAVMITHINNMIARMDLAPLPQNVDIEDALRPEI